MNSKMKIKRICIICKKVFTTDKCGYYKNYVAKTDYIETTRKRCVNCEKKKLNKIFSKGEKYEL